MKNLKKIGLLLSVVALMYSCSNQINLSKENEEIVKNYIKAVESNDRDTMDTLLADNYVGLGPSVGDSIGKEDAIENWKYNTENLYESIKYNKSRVISVNVPDGENKGEWVSNWAELTITYKSGEKAIIMTNTIYEIEDSKVVKSYTFYNEADVYKQLGFVFISK